VNTLPHLNAQALRTAAEQSRPTACRCALRPSAGWESFTEDRWPKAHMQALGTLRDTAVYEPTTDEYHPNGTRYDSADAPLAVAFFPCNRSDAFACQTCQSVLLRYTEFGGYYVDHRVRLVNAKLVVQGPDNA
jgi:hypothetical protein